MLSRLRTHAVAVALSTLGIRVIGWLGFYGYVWSDYDNEARPASIR